MNPIEPRHLSEDDLMRYADGELPAKESALVRRHLEACWECRTELEEMQKTVGDCIRFRKAVLESYLPPPPAPWFDIRREFMEVDRQSGHRTFWAAAGEILLAPARRPRQWATAIVALAAIFAIVFQFWSTPRVEAAELLRKAVAAAEPGKALERRIRIRTGGREVTRVVGVTRSAMRDALASVDAMFESARYDGNDPLSAASYLAWHQQLPEKQDEVTRVASDSAYLIRTTTQSGELLEATLKLRQRDLRAVEGTFQFRNRERVEVTELPPEPVSVNVPAIEPPALPSNAPNVLPPPVPAPTASGPATRSDELRVIAALHRIGADLGDPVEVSRSGERIVVTGIGLDAERRDEIARTLEAMPRVAVQFHESGAAELQTARPAAKRAPAGDEATLLQRQLEAYLGGRPAFERFADRLLEDGDTMMAHAHALRRLAERFPPGATASLDASDQELLDRIRQKLAAGIRRHGASIDSLVSPALRSLGVKPRVAAQPGGGTWQARAAELFQAAQEVERLLAVLVAGAAMEGGEGALGPRLLGSIETLRAIGEAREGQ